MSFNINQPPEGLVEKVQWLVSAIRILFSRTASNSGGGSGVNIYNSDGTLTGKRRLNGAGNALVLSDIISLSSDGSFITPTMQVYTDGGNIVISDNVRGIYYDPASAIMVTPIAIITPASPLDGQEVIMSFGGQVTSGIVINNLTIEANIAAGQAILGTYPVKVSAGDFVLIKYRSSNGSWYRIA